MSDRTMSEVLDELVRTADLRARCRVSPILRGGSFERRCSHRLAILRAEAEQHAATTPAGTAASTDDAGRPRSDPMVEALINAGGLSKVKF